MKVLIKVFYLYHEVEAMQKGVFPVNVKEYKAFPDHAAAHSASVFVKYIKRMFPDLKLLRVDYGDDERDITELVINKMRK